jgi:hypothetical protein
MKETKSKKVVANATPLPKKPDPYISFGKAETLALKTMCLRSFKLYFVLKWLANFRTGVVGAFGNQKITFESLAVMVAIPTIQGRSASQTMIDGKEVSRLIERLVVRGLVTDIERKNGALTMRLPLSPINANSASADTSVPEAEKFNTESAGALTVEPPAVTPSMQVPPQMQGTADEWNADDVDDWSDLIDNLDPMLPTKQPGKSAWNPHEQKENQVSNADVSVLVNTDTQYLFSVPESAEREGNPSHVGSDLFLEGENPPELNAGQIQNRLRLRFSEFHYLDTAVSAKFFQRIAGLKVKPDELDSAAQALISTPTAKLTAGELFEQIVSGRKKPPWRLGARVAL